jgi:hypothetical protein
MSITIRRDTPEKTYPHNRPILAIVSAAESDEAIARIIKGFLTEEPDHTLLVSMSKQSDIDEMQPAEDVRSSPTTLLTEEEPSSRCLPPGEV